MATNISEARARHMREAGELMERDDDKGRDEHVSGFVSLSSEERDMRSAGRQLANEDDDIDVAGAIRQMMDVVQRQVVNNQRLMKKLDGVVSQLHEVVDEMRVIQENAQDKEHAAQQAAIMGVGMAQHNAEEAAIRGINETTKQSQASIKKAVESSKKYLESLTQESKKRIERLALITLPDKLFHGLLWVVLILVLFILSHVAWQIVM